jgi:hypothetical protein
VSDDYDSLPPFPLDLMFETFLGGADGLAEFLCPTARKPGGRPRGRLGATAQAIRAAVLDDLVARYDRMTVRQGYALEVAGVVEKTERGYVQVQRQLLAMRRDGLLAWDFIADGTRWQRKPSSWTSLEDYIETMARAYRRDLWRSRGVRIEVWLEKDALADVVYDVTAKWDVALMVSRGQSSATFLHAAAKAAEAAYEADGTETFVFALYDFDAGGARAARAVEEQVPEFAPGVPIHFERLGVTPAQIAAWSLPTRPPKAKDPEAATWGGKPCVELDAIDPTRLMALVESAITRHVNQHQWQVEQAVEAEERQGLLVLLDGRADGDGER